MLPLPGCREYELTSGQSSAAAGPSLRLSPHLLGSGGGGGGGSGDPGGSAAGLDAAAQEELAALSLDSPSDMMPELKQLRGQEQVGALGCMAGWGGRPAR